MIRQVQDIDHYYSKVVCEGFENCYKCTICKIRFLCYTTSEVEIILLKTGDYTDFVDFVKMQ